MTVFEFTFTEKFLIDCLKRIRRCSRFGGYGTIRLVLLALCLIGLITITLVTEEYIDAGVVSACFCLLLFVPRMNRWRITRRFRKSPYHNDRIRLTLSTEGLTAKGAKSESRWDWAAVTAARRLDDGFLLFQGPGVFNWLPTSALVVGSVEEADGLIQANVVDYKPS